MSTETLNLENENVATEVSFQAKCEQYAEWLTTIVNDPEMPDSITNPLYDLLLELGNRAQVNICTPEIARVALPLILERAGV